MSLINYITTGEIFKTLKWLDNDPKWKEAKRKTDIILLKIFKFYLPFIFIITFLMSREMFLLAIIFTSILFISTPVYFNVVLKPTIDKWYNK